LDRRSVRGVAVVGALLVAAAALLLVGGPSVTGGGGVAAPDLTVQFGVSAGTAATIVGALNSWWAAALSIALVPLGLGFAAASIRFTWTTLVRTIGKEAAKKAMVRL
jgi:hypothetical protein